MHRHELTDEQWVDAQPLRDKRTANAGRKPSDPRLMLNGIFWILHTGAPWRDLPERLGPWQTVYDHFSKWRREGVFARIIEALQIKLDENGLVDWELWCVDRANVRAARAAAGADKKVSSRTRINRPTTRWAAAEAGFGRKFLLLFAGQATPLPSGRTPGRGQ